MYKSLEIKQLAEKVGLDVPNGSDEHVLSEIASQLGVDFDGSKESCDNLYSALCDVKERMNWEKFWGDNDAEEFNDAIEYDENESYVDNNRVNNNSRDEDIEEELENEEKEKDEENGDMSSSDENNSEKNSKDKSDGEVSKEEGSTNNSSNQDSNPNNNIDNGNSSNNKNNANADKKEFGLDNKSNENPEAKGGNSQSSSKSNFQKSKPKENPNNINNGNKSSVSNSKKDNLNNKTLNHQKKTGKVAGNNSRPTSGLSKNSFRKPSRLFGKKPGSKVKDGAKNVAKKGVKAVAKGIKAAVSALMRFIASNPYVAAVVIVVVLVLFLIFFIVFFVIGDDLESSSISSSSGGNGCNYNLNGVVSSGEVELSGVQVELINCDGSKDNYRVLETIDFEKYVVGVAMAEIGESSPDEAIKAQIVAARNFSLTRNSGMCPGNPDNCFYGYNATTKKIRMRACEADQVYADYDKTTYREARGAISLYSPEVNSGTVWKNPLSEEKKEHILSLANDVKGVVLLDQSGKVKQLGYNATTSNQFINDANSGMSYDKILSDVYSDGDFSHATCNAGSASVENIDYGDYVLSSDGDQIITGPLDEFLSSKGSSLEQLNSLIASNVDKAGFGSRAGVVAAAVTLVAELGNKYDAKVPYYWGGGHSDGVVVGSLAKWGSNQCGIEANGRYYNQCGLDCSGFVTWAMKNGGYNIGSTTNFRNISGAKFVTLSSTSPSVKPGDFLESSGHVTVVVAIDEASSSYIIAHASGQETGILFSKWSYSYAAGAGYWGVDMDDYYANGSNVRS